MSTSKSGQEKESIDAIRSLLFGEQVQSIQGDLKKLEASLRAGMASLDERLTEQIGDLQEYVDTEFQAIGERFEKEEQNRKQAVASNRDKMEVLHKESGERVRKLQKRLTTSEESAKKALSERSQVLKKQMQENKKRLESSIATEVSAIDQSAAHRSEIGELLIELGKGIQGNK